MARKVFKLPDIGEGTAEAELVAWHVAIGDVVAEDQTICDVMTDKATVELTAPFAGKVVERTGVPGDMLPIGSVVLVFEVGEQPVEPSTAVAEDPAVEPEAAQTPVIAPRPRVLTSPAVRKRAADLGVDLFKVIGTGGGGRIRQADVDTFLAYENVSADKPVPSPPAPMSHGASPTPAPAIAPPGPVDEGYDDVPVIGLRRRIAERMQDTKRRIPHFSYIEEVDVTRLESLRERLNATRSEGRVKLTLLPFLIQALTRALPEFPQINAIYDDTGGYVRRFAAVHAGIATQTPAGLVVTVLRDAARHDLWQTAGELIRLSGLARAGKAASTDLTGSTITITSLGAMGGVATTPVINSPEVAIIGVNKVIERPIVSDGQIRIAKMMNLSSSFDHRVVDGWDAALFVQRLKSLLEEPALLFIDR